jgi:lipoprotein-anchoring transpeptidase ErfK/SrfK
MREARRAEQSSWLRRFMRRYGWRAYALPVLAALTAVVLAAPSAAMRQTASTTGQGAGARQLAAVDPPPIVQINAGSDKTPCARNTEARLVLVSIAAQRAWMCQAAVQVYSTLVTTGADNVGDGTPLGTWHVQDKQTDRYLVGPGYRDFVHYWMPFDGDFGFHDSPWQTMPYGSSGYKANGSHGCIHLPAAAMTWFFGWASTGTTVTIAA